MDLTTTIIGATILALCTAPLVMAGIKKKKKQKNMLQTLMAHAESHSCRITEYDLWRNTAIGIDENANCLFFVNKGAFQQVHLAGIKKVYANGEADPSSAEKLEMVLVYTSNVPDMVFEFYNHAISMQIDEELILLKKWQAIVQSGIGK